MPALILPDPKAPTFDRARLTPEGFVRDPKGDVLIIPDGVLAADVPEWAAFVRESRLPHTRAAIRAGLKGGYSVYTMFDKDSGWWDTRQHGPAGTAPSIRLARFHAFQALAQRVLEDDPTNTEAILESVFATQAIARGDREPTFGEVLRDGCIALNTAEAAKKVKEDSAMGPHARGTVTGKSATEQALQAGDTIRVKASASDYHNLYRYDGAHIFNNTGKDIPAGSVVCAAGKSTDPDASVYGVPLKGPWVITIPTTERYAKPPAEKPPEVAPWTPGDTRLFDRWFAGSPNLGIVAYKDSGEFKNLSAYAYADKWGVYVGNDTQPIEGNEGSFEQNLIAAERTYRTTLAAKQEYRRVIGQGNIEAQIVQVGGKRPVGEWYAWIHDTSRRFKVYADNADELYARAGRDGWWVYSDHKALAKGDAGSLEANTRAAERLYQHYAAEKDAEKKAAKAAKAPPPPPAPAKDRYKVLPSTVDVYTTPTHIAIGQVWRDAYGATAMVSSVTTFEDNYAADTDGEVLNLEYDKDGRITDYGDCTYAGYVPVVWLDKVPSGG